MAKVLQTSIQNGVAFDGRQDAQGDADDDGKHHAGQGQVNGCRDTFQKNIPHRSAGGERVAEIELDSLVEKVGVLDNKRFIKAVSLLLGFVHRLVVVVGDGEQEARRIASQVDAAKNYEAERYQGDETFQQATGDVNGHLRKPARGRLTDNEYSVKSTGKRCSGRGG